jgi:hypothetical protein
MSKFEKWNETLSSLSPRSPAQTALVSSMGASSAAFQQTRLSCRWQLASPISWPLIVIVVSRAMLLFFGFGVTSGLNPTRLGALAFGSFAGGERDLFDPRAQPAVLRTLPSSHSAD